MLELIKRNGKLYFKIMLWGLIPFAVGLILFLLGLFLGYISDVLFFALVWSGIAIVLLDVIVCFVICLVKREKATVKQ